MIGTLYLKEILKEIVNKIFTCEKKKKYNQIYDSDINKQKRVDKP